VSFGLPAMNQVGDRPLPHPHRLRAGLAVAGCLVLGALFVAMLLVLFSIDLATGFRP
jgi:hypothetical protein